MYVLYLQRNTIKNKKMVFVSWMKHVCWLQYVHVLVMKDSKRSVWPHYLPYAKALIKSIASITYIYIYISEFKSLALSYMN